jgi:hypothetical protein
MALAAPVTVGILVKTSRKQMGVDKSPDDPSEIRYFVISGLQAFADLPPGPGLLFALCPASNILGGSPFRSFATAEVGPDDAASDLFHSVVQALSASNFPGHGLPPAAIVRLTPAVYCKGSEQRQRESACYEPQSRCLLRSHYGRFIFRAGWASTKKPAMPVV